LTIYQKAVKLLEIGTGNILVALVGKLMKEALQENRASLFFKFFAVFSSWVSAKSD